MVRLLNQLGHCVLLCYLVPNVQKEWTYTFTSPYALIAWCKYIDNSTLSFVWGLCLIYTTLRELSLNLLFSSPSCCYPIYCEVFYNLSDRVCKENSKNTLLALSCRTVLMYDFENRRVYCNEIWHWEVLLNSESSRWLCTLTPTCVSAHSHN